MPPIAFLPLRPLRPLRPLPVKALGCDSLRCALCIANVRILLCFR